MQCKGRILSFRALTNIQHRARSSGLPMLKISQCRRVLSIWHFQVKYRRHSSNAIQPVCSQIPMNRTRKAISSKRDQKREKDIQCVVMLSKASNSRLVSCSSSPTRQNNKQSPIIHAPKKKTTPAGFLSHAPSRRRQERGKNERKWQQDSQMDD